MITTFMHNICLIFILTCKCKQMNIMAIIIKQTLQSKLTWSLYRSFRKSLNRKQWCICNCNTARRSTMQGLELLKEVPGYKAILKAVIKQQIQSLVRGSGWFIFPGISIAYYPCFDALDKSVLHWSIVI